MNMKVRKSVIAFLMATTMVGSTAVPAMADTATVTVSIKTTGLTGALQKTADYILPETSIPNPCWRGGFRRSCPT